MARKKEFFALSLGFFSEALLCRPFASIFGSPYLIRDGLRLCTGPMLISVLQPRRVFPSCKGPALASAIRTLCRRGFGSPRCFPASPASRSGTRQPATGGGCPRSQVALRTLCKRLSCLPCLRPAAPKGPCCGGA